MTNDLNIYVENPEVYILTRNQVELNTDIIDSGKTGQYTREGCTLTSKTIAEWNKEIQSHLYNVKSFFFLGINKNIKIFVPQRLQSIAERKNNSGSED